MKTIAILTTVLLVSFSINKGRSSTITVAPSGADYKSVQQGVDAASPGDIIVVKAGIYHETVAFNKSGSEKKYITLQGEAGSVIDGSENGTNGISIFSQNYIKVIGMEIQNFKSGRSPVGINVRGSSSHIELRNNKVHNIENANGNAHGIAFYGTELTPISDIIIDGNEIRNCKLGQSESLVLNGNVTDFVVSNNVIHDNDNIGIDFIGWERTGPEGFNQARNGVCFGNTVYNISTKTNPTYNELNSDGIYVDGGRDITIEKNIIYNCDIGIEVASEHGGKSTENIIVRNNFVSGSYQANIMTGGYAANRGSAINIIIVNNTTYQGREGEVALQHNCDKIFIKNNIFYGKSDQAYLQNRGTNNKNVDVANNIYYGQSTSSPGSWPDAHAKFADPMLVNPYQNMHLKAGSPAIDAGIDTGMDSSKKPLSGKEDLDNQSRIINGKIDIGADEYEF